MKVQLLTFPGCPNADSARSVLRRALSTAGLPEDFEEINTVATETPEELRDWGSPTILVDGVDVGGEPSPTGQSCRLYGQCDGHAVGVPSESQLRAALRAPHD